MKEIFGEYLKILLIFTIGIIVAIMLVNKTSQEQRTEIKSYIDMRINLVKEGKYTNQREVFFHSIKQNLKDFCIMFFLASTVIGVPIVYFFIVKKAFSIGYTSACIFATQSTKRGIIFICNALVFHNIIYLVSICMILVSGICFVRAIRKKPDSLKLEIFKYLIWSGLGLIVIIVSSLCEAYISINFLYLLKKYL